MKEILTEKLFAHHSCDFSIFSFFRFIYIWRIRTLLRVNARRGNCKIIISLCIVIGNLLENVSNKADHCIEMFLIRKNLSADNRDRMKVETFLSTFRIRILTERRQDANLSR